MIKAKIRNLLSPIEQLTISGLSFYLNGILILFSSKITYGHFSLLYSYILLMMGVYSAVIGTPMCVELAAEKEQEQNDFISAVTRVILMVSGIALIIMLSVIIISDEEKDIAAFFFALIICILRELSRGILLIKEQLAKSLLTTLLCSMTIVIVTLATVCFTGSITIFDVFLTIGVANFAFSLPHLFKNIGGFKYIPVFGCLSRLWIHTKWALPGVFVIWIQNNAFLTLVTYRLGPSAAADLASARLLIMPYLSAFSGYTRPMIIHFGKLLNSGLKGEAIGYIKESMSRQFKYCGSMAFVFIVCYAMQSYFSLFVKYENICLYGAAWAVFALVSCSRSPLGVYFQAAKEFKMLFYVSIFSAFISVLLVLLFLWINSEIGVIFALAIAEAILLFYLLKKQRE